MNIFQNTLFLYDYPGDARASHAEGQRYARGYGNHVASAQAFAPLGHAHAGKRRDDIAAPRRATAPAGNRCPVYACA